MIFMQPCTNTNQSREKLSEHIAERFTLFTEFDIDDVDRNFKTTWYAAFFPNNRDENIHYGRRNSFYLM